MCVGRLDSDEIFLLHFLGIIEQQGFFLKRYLASNDKIVINDAVIEFYISNSICQSLLYLFLVVDDFRDEIKEDNFAYAGLEVTIHITFLVTNTNIKIINAGGMY